MKSSILTFSSSLILGITLAHGAVITVGSGESIQTAVDGAADGDEIVLTYPGQYVGNVTVNGKGLTIRSLRFRLHQYSRQFFCYWTHRREGDEFSKL